MATKGSKLTGHSNNDEMQTPKYIWNWLNKRFLFNYDAASSHSNHLCQMYSTQDGTFKVDMPGQYTTYSPEDGLTFPWHGLRVFLNPPYSRPLLAKFIAHAVEQKDNANCAVLLVKVDTSTAWWRLLAENAHIEYLRRVAYDDENGNPLSPATFASAIAIMRPTEPYRLG